MNQEKYIKVMPEYCSNHIWGRDGVMLSLSSLETQYDDLIQKLIIWGHEWEKLADKELSGKKISPKVWHQIREKGEEIARNILDEHPDWDVYYTFEGSSQDLKKINLPKPLYTFHNISNLASLSKTNNKIK